MTGFIIRTGITAVALWVAVSIVPGLVNATLRPVAVILSIPATILTFGLFLLVVNAAMLGLVAALLPSFTVSGFWAALFGAVVVSIVSGFINRAARGD